MYNNNNNNTNTNNTNTMLPPPPIFKPKFISSNSSPIISNNDSVSNSNNTNTNFLTSSFISNDEYNKNNLYNHSPSISPMTRFTNLPLPNDIDELPNPKKRRKSSINNGLSTNDQIERKKKDLKTQHSIIEKRRRIKMNREFDALKFLIPACRLNILSNIENNNTDIIDSMHKLTILQSTVEYIKYLHLIIKLLKLQMLKQKSNRNNVKNWLLKNNNLDFCNFDIDLQKFRDLNNDFNLLELFNNINADNKLDPINLEIENLLNDNNNDNNSNIRNKINENSNYRKSILQLQNDSNSFKLPLPAIIDKHIDIELPKRAKSLSSSSSSSSLLSNSSPSYTYTIPNTVSAVSNNVIQYKKKKPITVNDDIKAASHVLVGLKSDNISDDTSATSKRHPSIKNILN